MTYAFHVVQIVSAIFIIALVLLQRAQPDVGGFGSDNGSLMQTRRGFERFLFFFTVSVAVLFAMASIAVVVLSA